jgi:hypothetical protein
MKRKCAQCKEAIEIDNNNIVDVICYEKSYYHKHCFCALAEKRSQSKRGKPEKWQAALDNISQIEAETVQTLRSLCAKDELNVWLLDNYDITAVPARFWQIVADLEQGVYKGKKSKSITMETLLGAWKWGQRKLDSIAKSNKAKRTGPQSDDARIMYDLSILVSKIPNYLAQKAKADAVQAAAKVEVASRINYNNVQKTEIKPEGLDDISAMLDEF